jgi:hypothetical protein
MKMMFIIKMILIIMLAGVTSIWLTESVFKITDSLMIIMVSILVTITMISVLGGVLLQLIISKEKRKIKCSAVFLRKY